MKYDMVTIITLVTWFENKEELILYRMPTKKGLFLAPFVNGLDFKIEPKEMNSEKYCVGERYRHFKGGTVVIVGTALKGEIPSVIYRGEQDDKIYARAISSFEKESQPGVRRFEKITITNS